MMRPLNCLMASIGVFVGGLIITGVDFPLSLGLAMFAAFLITGGGNVFNDYIDFEADRVNKPKRPIPSGKVSRKSSLLFSMVLFFLGVVIAGFINWVVFLIAAINSLLLIGYSVVLQDKIFLGNITIGYLVGSIFLFGGASIGDLGKIFLPFILTLLAMLSTISREIVKDLEDIKGDRLSFLKKITYKVRSGIAERFGIGKRGVKLRYSEKLMITFAMSSMGIAILLSFLPYYYGVLRMSYLVPVVIADVIFLTCIISLGMRKKNYENISKRMKFGMFIALVAFIAGVFI
jgi:geranylgeranylglycerol-phosphate geranylgeranyltransferase